MKIEKCTNGDEQTIPLTGRLDTTTAPQLASELKAILEGVKTLALDFAGLDYLSSAGDTEDNEQAGQHGRSQRE